MLVRKSFSKFNDQNLEFKIYFVRKGFFSSKYVHFKSSLGCWLSVEVIKYSILFAIERTQSNFESFFHSLAFFHPRRAEKNFILIFFCSTLCCTVVSYYHHGANCKFVIKIYFKWNFSSLFIFCKFSFLMPFFIRPDCNLKAIQN